MLRFKAVLRACSAGALLAGLLVSWSGLARADCQPGFGACPANLGGGCAPLGTTCCAGGTHVAPGQNCPPEPAGNYGASAAGISGGHVGVGYSTNYPTQSAADAKALQECEARTNNCKVVGRFWNGGCGYITTAVSNGTCYGYGATPQTAKEECQSRGCTCQTPIGGCTNAP